MSDRGGGVRAALRQGLRSHWARVEHHELARVEAEYRRRTAAGSHILVSGGGEARLLIGVLLDGISAAVKAIASIEQAWRGFTERYPKSETEEQRSGHLLDMAVALGAGAWKLWGDRRSLRRGFDYEALRDRYRDARAEQEKRLVFLLDRLGVIAASVLRAGQPEERRSAWRQLDIESSVLELLRWGGDCRVQAAAFRCLGLAIQGIPSDRRQDGFGEATLRVLYRACLDGKHDVWVQCAALEALHALSPSGFIDVAERRLRERGEDGDLFVRRRMIELAGEMIAERPECASLLELGVADPSPHVRQAVSQSLVRLPAAQAVRFLRRMAIGDEEPCVRMAALLGAVELVKTDSVAVVMLISDVLQGDSDTGVVRTALQLAEQGCALLSADAEAYLLWCRTLSPAVARLRSAAPSLAVRRWAAMAAERLWCWATPEARGLYQRLEPRLTPLRCGHWRRLSKALLANADRDVLGRVLSLLARNDFGYEAVDTPFGLWVFKGERMRWRLWRTMYEIAHPGSDKRQGYSHVVGRVYWGRIQAPPGGLGELSQTKVPGEPLVMPDEQSWRPYLPLPDQVLSAIDSGGTTRIYTAEGVTVIRAPDGWVSRGLARLRLSWRFAELARLRNWRPDEGRAPHGYVTALKTVGADLSYHPYAGQTGTPGVDPAVTRFFPALLPWIDPDLLGRFYDYLFSVYENTLDDLALFLVGIALIFFGGLIRMHGIQRRNRRALPLVIGGWGTRGKSGTERLKAAMLNALGYGLLSKTTGCEAMVVYARPFRPLRELVLYRPYDKATIWEQINVVRLAKAMKAKIVLWECMGLRPAYVRILQSQWMRDDFSTITNTYPDHEDIQGPAGRNIPDVMADFIPSRSTLVTSEEEMLPVLADAAAAKGTRCLPAGWQDAALIAPDVLARFPYEEHPNNIALVLRLASELGISRDFALKEMADRVVPDLGVLKSYPVASVDGRRLEFVNGMSANERYGCLANWKRMGFETHDPTVEPGVWLTTVVNNRADREARSQVFARILAEDLSADCHVFIGSNLSGLQQFVRSSWAQRMERVSLWPADGTAPCLVLERWARWLRVPRAPDQVDGRVRAMVRGLGLSETVCEELDVFDVGEFRRRVEREQTPHGEAMAAHLATWGAQLRQYMELAGRLDGAVERREQLDGEFRQLLSEWFFARIMVIEDFHASGDDIVRRIAARTPPGLLNRIMGIQNIKGTGLDFVYGWQTWDRCCAALRQLESGREEEAMAGLRDLAALPPVGVLGEARVRLVLAEARERPFFQTGDARMLADKILAGLDREGRTVGTAVTRQPPRSALRRAAAVVIEALEQVLDLGDAVSRRKKADRIYRALAAQRIGAERAAADLWTLHLRQKGGWLRKMLSPRGQA